MNCEKHYCKSSHQSLINEVVMLFCYQGLCNSYVMAMPVIKSVIKMCFQNVQMHGERYHIMGNSIHVMETEYSSAV